MGCCIHQYSLSNSGQESNLRKEKNDWNENDVILRNSKKKRAILQLLHSGSEDAMLPGSFLLESYFYLSLGVGFSI